MEIVDFLEEKMKQRGGYSPVSMAHDMMEFLIEEPSITNGEMAQFCEIMEGYIKAIRQGLSEQHPKGEPNLEPSNLFRV